MLKYAENEEQLENLAAAGLQALLQRIPSIRIDRLDLELRRPGPDIVAEVSYDGHRRVLVCEVKPIGQPRHVKAALFQLKKYAAQFDPPAQPMFVAPYLSSEAQALCREFEVGYFDFVGNALVAFDKVFIERSVDTKPPAVQRTLVSVFKPKSAQVLRALLRDPDRTWRVTELAQHAGVSLGHVSNVRTELVDREWGEITEEGLRLSQPGRLLDAWRQAYKAPDGERLSFYTTLHGAAFDADARKALNASPKGPRAVFSSFSASHWLAPFGRLSTQYFFADKGGVEQLCHSLKLSSAPSGANVIVKVLKEPGLFIDAIEPAPGVFCTSPVQTYLDLTIAGERGQEAAEHLREEALSW